MEEDRTDAKQVVWMDARQDGNLLNRWMDGGRQDGC